MKPTTDYLLGWMLSTGVVFFFFAMGIETYSVYWATIPYSALAVFSIIISGIFYHSYYVEITKEPEEE